MTCSYCGKLGHNKRKCPTRVCVQDVIDNFSTVEVDPPEVENHIDLLKYDAFTDTNTPYTVQVSQASLRSQYDLIILKLKQKIYLKYAMYCNDPISYDEFCKFGIEDPNNPYPEIKKYSPWFENNINTMMKIYELLQENKFNHFLICCPCGGGKSNLINYISYYLSTLIMYCEDNIGIDDIKKYRRIENQYVLTGYSSTDYVHDMSKNLNFINKDNIYHLNTIQILGDKIKEDESMLFNAVFYLDEARLVVQKDQTIDKFMKILGIDNAKIQAYNILFFYIDATPDSLFITLDSENIDNVAPIVSMETGVGYQGIREFMDNSLIFKIENIKLSSDNDISIDIGIQNIINLITQSDGNTVMRITDNRTRKEFINQLGGKRIKYAIYGENHEWNDDEFPTNFNEAINKNYGEPCVFILIQRFKCSKRLILGPNIKIIYDQLTKNKNDTSTTNGLVSRFFGYYDMSHCSVSIFLCKEHYNRYIEFIKNGYKKIPDGYRSSLVHSNCVDLKTQISTYPEHITNKKENNKIEKEYIEKGYIFSGSTFQNVYAGYDQEKCNKIYNINQYNGEYKLDSPSSEVFENEYDMNNRIKFLKSLHDIKHLKYNHSRQIISSWKEVSCIGNTEPTSNLPMKKLKNNKDICFRVRKFKNNISNDNERIKYHVRWMMKIPN